MRIAVCRTKQKARTSPEEEIAEAEAAAQESAKKRLKASFSAAQNDGGAYWPKQAEYIERFRVAACKTALQALIDAKVETLTKIQSEKNGKAAID